MDLHSWIGVAILLGAFLFIGLAGFAATNSWRGFWQALREYLQIMGAFVLVGGGAGLIAAIGEHGIGPLWELMFR